jgi:hypothetical protein
MSEQTRGLTDADFGEFYRAQTREWRAKALYDATPTLRSIVAQDALDAYKEIARLKAAKDTVIARLADIHHRTVTGSRNHDPENTPDFRRCPCLTCREAQLALTEPHTQPCHCVWCIFQTEVGSA